MINDPNNKVDPGMGDSEIALKFRGRWIGKWAIGEHGGDFVLVVSEVKGVTLAGETYWYNTASLSPKDRLEKAVVNDGVLTADHPCGVKIRLEFEGEELVGTWKFNRYKGTLHAMRDNGDDRNS